MIEILVAGAVILTTVISTACAYLIGVNHGRQAGRIEGINIGTWRGWRTGFTGNDLPADVSSLSELSALDQTSKIPAQDAPPQDFRTSDEGRPVEGNDPPERGFWDGDK